jgi:plasmid maintenance system antidote protein VapI
MKTITKPQRLRQHNPPHPGEVLFGLWMEPLGLSVTELAGALGVSARPFPRL